VQNLRLIKPGAGFKKIVWKTVMDSFRLTKNYIYNNDSKNVLLQIVKFLQDSDNANKIMLNVPFRYDLSDNSYVNKEIKALNSKLKKIAKII
jgi:hypothetical protein